MTPVYVAQCHLQSACNVQSFHTDSFESSIFTDRSRILKMCTAGFSSTLHLIDLLIAAMGSSNDTCYPTWRSVRWDHIQTEIQRCCSKSLHVCCLMGLFQSDYWFGRKVREQPQPSQRIKHTGRIQVTIKHCHNSFQPFFSIVHLCKYRMLIRIMIIINQNPVHLCQYNLCCSGLYVLLRMLIQNKRQTVISVFDYKIYKSVYAPHLLRHSLWL